MVWHRFYYLLFSLKVGKSTKWPKCFLPYPSALRLFHLNTDLCLQVSHRPLLLYRPRANYMAWNRLCCTRTRSRMDSGRVAVSCHLLSEAHVPLFPDHAQVGDAVAMELPNSDVDPVPLGSRGCRGTVRPRGLTARQAHGPSSKWPWGNLGSGNRALEGLMANVHLLLSMWQLHSACFFKVDFCFR